MADYSRPASGFSFKFGGQNTRSVPDKLQEDKYVTAQNVRAYDDVSIRTRPGLTKISDSLTNAAVTALRAYAALGTDNLPRYLYKANSSLFLDNGTAVDTGYAVGVGASLIPYRPNQSPESWMYAGDSNQYRKLSAPNASNVVTAQKTGIAEPQLPVDACMNDQQFSYTGSPAPAALTFTATGTAGSLTAGNRISDTAVGVYPDTTGLGTTSIQVSGASSTLPAGVYKVGAVTAYFWNHANNGVFQPQFPLDPTTATESATGDSLNFNYPGFTEPSFQPMRWAIISGTSVTDSFIPWSGANTDYDMVVTASLYVPVAGNYTININHDDGMLFAIGGANFVSGPVNDGAPPHTKTAVLGLSFATGAPVAGTNQEGSYTEVFVVNFPAPGIYPIEVDYNQRTVYQEMNVLFNGSNLILDAGSTPGYQRYMALDINNGGGSQTFTVQDVFPPLPNQLAIESIYYYTGSTGRCVIVPASLSPVPGTDGQSLYEPNILSGIRRGSLIQIGSEVCLVWNVSNGPTGNVCFETSTVTSHTTAENLLGIQAISIFDPSAFITTGSTINSSNYIFTIGPGIGAISAPVLSTPFVINNFSFQPEDYVHFSINVDTLANMNEMKILFDVGDSTFTRNFYYYSVRPNDIVAGVANTLTQLGVSQLVAQRSLIDEEQADESGNQGFTSSSSQTTTGDSQWSEIIFPISALTRIGNDQSKSLQNTVAVQLLFNCNAPINVEMNSISTIGGFAPDVGDTGAPYQYVIRARSSITGAKSNPSPPMRYGVTTRRGQVGVVVPTSYADTQADQWDVFRLGGSVTNYTYIGSVPIGSSNIFNDTYSDVDINSSTQAEYDNFEPWPTVDVPLNVSAISITGSTALVTITDPVTKQTVLRYLPGNLVQVSQQVYRLWTRPTQLSGSTFLFQFVENAGSGTNQAVTISEPAMANQILPYLWGPTEEGGNIFACGDSARPGFVYFCKNFQPDSAPDKYNLELCPPSEPLLGGETLNGNSYVASTMRWWQMRPSFGGENQYTPIEAPVGRGLAAPFGHCTDGSRIFFVAKDGIYVHSGGAGESLTDADYYNLFPHEGVSGQNVTYNGVTTFAPDYGRAETFRLEHCNNYLFFDYQDSTGTPRNMVFDVRHRAWSTDVILGGTGASIHYNVEQQEGSLGVGDVNYGLLIVGSSAGAIYRETDNTIDGSNPINCILATREMTAGDDRAQKLFGDVFLDFNNPTSAVPTNFTVQVMNLGQSVETLPLTQSASRQQLPLDLSGGEYLFSLGLFITWTAGQTMAPVTLYTWQPSYISKPELTAGRVQDWDDAGYQGAKWVQGFILQSNTSGSTKQIGVRNGDNQVLQQVFPVTAAIQDEQAFSFTQPFVCHMLRIEPQDEVDWNFFSVRWIWEPCPETVTTWWSQGSALTFTDYGHVYNLEVAYAAGSDVNFTMFFDGKQQDYVLPATGGQYQKYNLNLMVNKGKVYSFRFQSSSGNRDLQLWLQDMVFQVGSWDRTTPYDNYAKLGGNRGDGAKI